MCPYSKQVQDIELYGASVGDDLDAKMNYFKHINGLFYVYWLLIEEVMHDHLKLW